MYNQGKMGPKPKELAEDVDAAQMDQWQSNILYNVSTIPEFKPFCEPLVTWQISSPEVLHQTRGFMSDTTRGGVTASQKVERLEQMLSYIASYVPVFIREDIVRNSTSLDSVFKIIRNYYSIKRSETNFMKYLQIVWEPNERPERLYQRLRFHLQSNLLRADDGMLHNGKVVTVDEVMSPTVERLIVLRWMELIHSKLQPMVARTFAYDCQRMSSKDLQPMIRDGLDGLLEQLKTEETMSSANAIRTDYNSRPRPPREFKPNNQFANQKVNQYSAARKPNFKQPNKAETCRLCKAEGRMPYGHSLITCEYISKGERRDMVKAYSVEVFEQAENINEETFPDMEENEPSE